MNNKPTAHISVSKNRVRKGREVYLKDDTEFEIELYNPTQLLVVARFWINGIEMQGGGIVLNPAQRVHLDRYLDEPKKLKFSTYEVSGSKAEIEHAIKNNGLIQVKFYNEIIPVIPQVITTTFPSYPDPYPHWNQGPSVFGPGSNPTITSINCNDTVFGGTLSGGVVGSDMCFLSSNVEFNANDFLIEPVLNDEFKDMTPIESQPKEKKCKSKKKESGRIEAGSKSDQTLVHVDKSFAFSPCAEYEYVILPMSEKITEAKDIGGKVYCTGCKLRKRKPNWEFCPKCGTQFEY